MDNRNKLAAMRLAIADFLATCQETLKEKHAEAVATFTLALGRIEDDQVAMRLVKARQNLEKQALKWIAAEPPATEEALKLHKAATQLRDALSLESLYQTPDDS